MRTPSPRTTLQPLVCSLIFFTASPAFAQKKADATATFFETDKVVQLKLEISPKPLGLLRLEPRKYVTGTVTEGQTEYPNLGVHLRGGIGSFRAVDEKAGFTFNMNKFGKVKTFHGMDKWHLNNSAQDPSYLSEIICGELMRDAGVPCSRFSHTVVTFNDKVLGMYLIKEGYDKYFLISNFKNSDGNFYDGGFLKDIDQQPELVRAKDDVKDWADLKALHAACQEPDLKKRFEKLEKLIDMDIFISCFCMQAILGDWDGYVFNRNNYRIYHDPKRDKIIFIPSGMDQEFGNAVQGPLVPPMKGLVAIAVYQTPEGKSRYLKRMAEINTKIMFSDKWNKRLDELQALLKPELTKLDPKVGADYIKHVDRIRDFFRDRPKSIERQLKVLK